MEIGLYTIQRQFWLWAHEKVQLEMYFYFCPWNYMFQIKPEYLMEFRQGHKAGRNFLFLAFSKYLSSLNSFGVSCPPSIQSYCFGVMFGRIELSPFDPRGTCMKKTHLAYHYNLCILIMDRSSQFSLKTDTRSVK